MKGEGNIDVAGVSQTSGRGWILQHKQSRTEKSCMINGKRKKVKKTNISKVKLRSTRNQAAREGQK